MAMMKRLRDSTKIIMILTAIAFVGLMVFEWGMDLSGVSSRTGSQAKLGSVNGADISIDDYQQQYRNRYEEAERRAGNEGLSPEQLREIEEQAWQDVVNLTLLRHEARRRGIRIADAELIEYIRNNPPAEIARLPALQTEGQFDIQKYRQALADPALAETWADYEAQLRQTLPIQKLQEQIIAGITVTDAELLGVYKARNEQARIRYVHLDPNRLVPDAWISVTEEEIRDYHREHRDDYRREASAKIEYAVFRAPVTVADSATAHARADSLARMAARGDIDFGELAQDESGDELTRGTGGELGWFELSTMDPAIAAVLRNVEPGQVSNPVLTPFGWHVLKLEDRITENDAEPRYRARHILVPIEPAPTARDSARVAAQEFARRVSEQPAAFARLTSEQGLRVGSTPLFEKGPVVPGIGPASTIAEFAFSNDPGSVSGPLEQEGAFYVVHVVERHPAGVVALERLADEIRASIRERKKRQIVVEMAPRFRDAVRQRGLDGAAREWGLETRTTGWFNRLNNIPGIGSGTPVAGAAFGIPQGQVAGPIEGPQGLYFIQLLEKRPYDPTAFEREKASLREQLKVTAMRETFNAWFEELRERAEVRDNRAQLLGT